jgi:hypothetical protein
MSAGVRTCRGKRRLTTVLRDFWDGPAVGFDSFAIVYVVYSSESESSESTRTGWIDYPECGQAEGGDGRHHERSPDSTLL